MARIMNVVYKMLDEFTKYGLTEIQAKVYLNLIRLGRSGAINIAKEIGVHRAEIYRVLRELKEKNLCTDQRGRPIIFTPIPPEDTLNVLLEEQLKKAEYLRERMPKMVKWLNSQAKGKKVKPSVLLIEDDESVRKSLIDLLKKNEFDVETASDGNEALSKIRSKLYNVALIDIRLPDIEGTKLLRKLKEENPDIKEIIITGYPSLQSAIDAVNEGADAYILKPFNPKELLAKIKEKLG